MSAQAPRSGPLCRPWQCFGRGRLHLAAAAGEGPRQRGIARPPQRGEGLGGQEGHSLQQTCIWSEMLQPVIISIRRPGGDLIII